MKKGWFSHETGLVFVHGDVFKDGSKNSCTFKMELFATISNARVYNQWTVVFACCCGKSTIFTGKIKIGWKSLKVSFVDMFLHFFENANYFMFHQHYVLFRKLITNIKTDIIVDFIFRVLLTEATIHMFWKMLIKCRETVVRKFFFKKK